MRYKRVLLIIPCYPSGQNVLPLEPYIGIGYIAESLQREGIDCEFVDMRFNYSGQRLKNKLNVFQPDLVGLSMMTFLHRKTYDLIRMIKKVMPEVDVVVGGPHVSTLREAVLDDLEAIRYGIVLEGEEAIVELCRGEELSTIQGLIYRNNGQVIYTGDRECLADLDEIPFPQYGKFELDNYLIKSMPIITSRGCPFECIYCPVKAAIGGKFRARSAPNVLEEISYWYERGYRNFNIMDDNFTLLPERTMEICDLIQARHFNDVSFNCPNGIRADKADRKVLTRLKEAGFQHIAFGVEAGNDRILKNLNKGEKIEEIERAIGVSSDLDFQVSLFFLIGSPGETWQDIEDSIRLALKYPVAEARFYNLIPFPKTKLFDWVRNNGYFVRPPEEYLNDANHFVNDPCFATPQLSLEERRRAFVYANRISRKIRRRAYARRLRRFGPLGRPIAFFYTLGPLQKIHSRSIRQKKLREWIKRTLKIK